MKPFGDEATLRRLLQQVKAGERSIEQAIAALQPRPLAADLGFATIDHDRARRCGFPEVVFCQGKEPTQAAAIAVEIMTRADRLLMTRADAAHADAVRSRLPAARYHERARCLTIEPAELAQRGLVAVVSAGTSDLPVADEAAVTLRLDGNRVEQFTDIGIAGLHRLLARIDEIRAANVIVVAAGMEGALPSAVAGLVDKPVIAIPTSVGYGASFGGLAALLGMLNSCAAGVAVVNIDNGFGAGYLASLINSRTVSPGPVKNQPWTTLPCDAPAQ